MLPVFSGVTRFFPPYLGKKSSVSCNPASFPVAWCSSSKLPSAPSKAACVKCTSLALVCRIPCCVSRKRRLFVTIPSTRSLELASCARLCRPRKRRSRRHNARINQKEDGQFSDASTKACAHNKSSGRSAPHRRGPVSPAHVQAPALCHHSWSRHLRVRLHRQKVSGFSRRHRRQRSRTCPPAHRQRHSARSSPCYPPIQPLSQCLSGSARPQARGNLRHGPGLFH